MKNASFLLSALFVLFVLCGGAIAQKSADIDSFLSLFPMRYEASWDFLMPYYLTLEPAALPDAPGPVKIKLIIVPTRCKEMRVVITKIDRLEYNGEVEWTFPCVPKDTFELELDVIIPPNDTSGLEFNIISDDAGMPYYAYFHTTYGRVKFYRSNHRIPFPSSKHKAPKTTIDMSDPPMTDELRYGKISVGYEDEEGNWIPVDSIENALKPTVTIPDRSKIWVRGQDGKHIRVDTVWLFDSLRQAKTQAQLEEMRIREQKPCTFSGFRGRPPEACPHLPLND